VRAHRPPEDVRSFGWLTQADAAHSVPLDMAAGGGLPLAAAYLAFVVLTGVALVRGLLRLTGPPLLLLGAFGGVWAAYQAQSLVSIDLPQLSMLHFLSAGAILALTASPRPAGPPPAAAAAVTRRGWPRFALALAAVPVAVVLALLATTIAAERELGTAYRAMQAGQPWATVKAARRAVALTRWQPSTWGALGRAYSHAGYHDLALDSHLQALRRDPRDFLEIAVAIDDAEALGRPHTVLALARRGIAVEPQAAEIKLLAARAALRLGLRDEARRWVEAALAFDPGHDEARALSEQIEQIEQGGNRR
jgi:putative inorganic carbon (HCO3(-)) transporter